MDKPQRTIQKNQWCSVSNSCRLGEDCTDHQVDKQCPRCGGNFTTYDIPDRFKREGVMRCECCTCPKLQFMDAVRPEYSKIVIRIERFKTIYKSPEPEFEKAMSQLRGIYNESTHRKDFE